MSITVGCRWPVRVKVLSLCFGSHPHLCSTFLPSLEKAADPGSRRGRRFADPALAVDGQRPWPPRSFIEASWWNLKRAFAILALFSRTGGARQGPRTLRGPAASRDRGAGGGGVLFRPASGPVLSHSAATPGGRGVPRSVFLRARIRATPEARPSVASPRGCSISSVRISPSSRRFAQRADACGFRASHAAAHLFVPATTGPTGRW